MTKHTPAPLTVMTKIAVVFQTSGAKRMLYPVSINDMRTYESVGFAFKQADADLFSTAPDMLTSLKEMKAKFESFLGRGKVGERLGELPDDEAALQRAQTIIDRAEGKSS